MHKQNIYKTGFIFLLLIVAKFSFSQDKITVQASADKNKILIGERINLTLEADFSTNATIQFFSFDSIPHFQVISKNKIDTASSSGKIILTQSILITSFDSGHWVIPSFVLQKNIKTDSIPVDVTFSDFDRDQNYHDIKDIIEVQPGKRKMEWWYFMVGGVIIGIIIFILTRKKKKTETPIKETIDPYKEAMQQLGQIKISPGTTKEYYSSLVNVFRLYIFRTKGIHSLQETTNDLVQQLKTVKLEKSQFEQLSQALQLSDFVKFAKYEPSEEDNTTIFETIKKSIQAIEQNKS